MANPKDFSNLKVFKPCPRGRPLRELPPTAARIAARRAAPAAGGGGAAAGADGGRAGALGGRWWPGILRWAPGAGGAAAHFVWLAAATAASCHHAARGNLAAAEPARRVA